MRLVPIGQTTQAMVYVPKAVPNGIGTENLVPLGEAGHTERLLLETGRTVAGRRSVRRFRPGDTARRHAVRKYLYSVYVAQQLTTNAIDGPGRGSQELDSG